MGKHKVVNQYTDSQGNSVIECACGWKEKAYRKAEADARFDRHAKFPHKS